MPHEDTHETPSSRRSTGYDEMNLAELNLGLPNLRALQEAGGEKRTPWEKGERSFDIEVTPNSFKTEWDTVVKVDGKSTRKRFYQVITAGKGLPNHFVNDVLVALLTLTEDNLDTGEIHTTRYQLLQMMGWDDSGHYYDRLQTIISQLVNMTIDTNALFDPDTKEHWQMEFNILDASRLKITDGESYITWSPTMLKLIRRSYRKSIDLEFYRSLPTGTARQLYRWLDKRFTRQAKVEMDVIELANRIVGYSVGEHRPSKAVRGLKRHLDHLAEAGYCTWDVRPSSTTDSGKKFVFQRRVEFECVHYPSRGSILGALVDLGLPAVDAENLIREAGWNEVLRQLEHYHFNVAGGKEIAYPAAWIKKAVRFDKGTGYALPAPLEIKIRKAYNATRTWCDQIFDTLPQSEREAIEEHVRKHSPLFAQTPTEEMTPDAYTAFIQERNRYLLDAISRPNVG
jgi:hypothetical protein